MRAQTPSRLTLVCSAVLFCTARAAFAQTLPPTPATIGAPAGTTAPIAGSATAAGDPGERPHHAQVNCDNGLLEVRAENSSLNSILRAVSTCTGMRITGGVPEQRVFGNYGPAAPATVIATLIDGTGSNMLLRETSADQPAELILTPRLGGPSAPSPSTYTDADAGDDNQGQARYGGQQPVNGPPNRYPSRPYPVPNRDLGRPASQQQLNQTPVSQAEPGSPISSPSPLPQPQNNVNGSPSNTSPTASTYPTTNSVPLDSVATPSTTPSTNGIVDAPNPAAAGSDTAGNMSATPNRTPRNTDFNPNINNQTATPGATSTNPNQAPAALTPEQIFQQLQQRQQQMQQQQQQQQPANPQ